VKALGNFLLASTIFFLIGHVSLGQKRFNIIVKLPKGIHSERIEAWLDDGKRAQRLKTNPTAINQLRLTGEYYSIYAVVSLQYPRDGSIKEFGNTFYVQEKPAMITFHPSNSLDSPFEKYSLQNIMEFKEEKKQMEQYAATEREKAMAYEAQYGDQIFYGHDTSVRNYYFNVLMKALGNKELEYIRNTTDSYYSFHCFRTNVIERGILSPDSSLLVFNSFPDKFRFSDEGNYLYQFIIGRLSSRKNSIAIEFDAKDINSKHILLSHFKGKKYVLLHFWATWCTPCMRELPALTKINDRWKSKDLQIISIALPSPKYADYSGTIRKYRMDWVHIYNDPDLINRYGNFATPRLCLINKDGKLIYDSAELANGDNELTELNKILKNAIN